MSTIPQIRSLDDVPPTGGAAGNCGCCSARARSAAPPASWGSRRSPRASGSPSTTTPTARSSCTSSGAPSPCDLDDEPVPLAAGEALFVPRHVRHRLRNTGDEPAEVVFHLGPLAPRPELGHVDTELVEQRRHRRDRRAAPWSPASVWSRRAAPPGTDSGRPSPTGVRRPGGSRFFDPSRFRSQIAAECDFDPVAAGLTQQESAAHRPVRAVRRWPRGGGASPTAAWTSTRRRPRARRGQPRQRRRRHHRAGGRVRRGQRRRPAAGWSTTRYGGPVPVPGPGPEQPRRRGGLPVRRCTAPPQVVSTGCTSGIDAIGYAHQLIAGRRGRHHDRRRRRRADLADHRRLLRRDQGHHRRTTTTRSTPPAPSTPTGDGFVLGEGARRAGAGGVRARPPPRARTSTARSPATPAAATPST